MVDSRKTHVLYKKSYVWSKKYLVDDPIGVEIGDIVEIVKVRPISKNKHWQITKVLGKDFVALGEEALKEEAKEAIEEVLPEEEKEESSDVSQQTEEEPKKEVERENQEKPVRKRKEKSVS